MPRCGMVKSAISSKARYASKREHSSTAYRSRRNDPLSAPQTAALRVTNRDLHYRPVPLALFLGLPSPQSFASYIRSSSNH